jgi:hypothetical protein
MGPERPTLALLTAATLLLFACHEQDASQANDEGEPRSAQMTVWENGYEAFVELEFAVAAVPVRLITHISEIATGFPRREGPVTFMLAGPSATILNHTEEKPARDGIYLPTLTFPTAGAWKVSISVPASYGDSEIHLPDITVYRSAEEALQAPEPTEPEGVSFLKEQQWQLSMRTAPARRENLTAQRKFPGRLLSPVEY